MLSTNDCVPAGAFAHVIAGERPSPGATPAAAWLNFTGICPPSGKPATVIVIGVVGTCIERDDPIRSVSTSVAFMSPPIYSTFGYVILSLFSVVRSLVIH